MNLVKFSLDQLRSVSHGEGLTLLHSERPKLHTILAFLSAIGLSTVKPAKGRTKIGCLRQVR